MTDHRTIAHMDLDTFFVSCERLSNKQLYGKPVLIGGTSDRGVVASCSYEARTFGVHSAMPMKMARQLCPEAVVIRGNTEVYSQYSHTVTEIIREKVPLFEKTSVDEFYLDLSGMDKFFGCMKYASELRKSIINNTGLPISFGLSSNKTVSKVATGQAKPNNELEVEYGREKVFLAPLSIQKIPMVGEKTYQVLRNMGVKTIQTIQKMPVELMESLLGKNGILIWKKANGIDNSPVIPYSDRKSISTERTFDRDTTNVAKLKSILLAMIENLAYQLRKQEKVTSCVTVKIRYSDFNTYTQQRKIPYTSADHVLFPVIFDLFEKLYQKRLLIRLIGVRLSGLVSGCYQINLFEDTTEMIRLYRAVDSLRNRFGDRAVVRAAGMNMNSFQVFNPFRGDTPVAPVGRRA